MHSAKQIFNNIYFYKFQLIKSLLSSVSVRRKFCFVVVSGIYRWIRCIPITSYLRTTFERKKGQIFVSIKLTRAIEFIALLMTSSEQHCKCLTYTLEEESRHTAPQNLLQGITKRVNECAVSVETDAHLRANIRVCIRRCENMSVHARAHTRASEKRE